MKIASVLVATLGAVLFVACGDDTGGGDGDDATTTGSGTSTFECCLNSVGYSCPDAAALDRCSGGDVNECMAGCQGDPQCSQACLDGAEDPDPSGCDRNDAIDCSSDPDDCAGTAIPCDLDLDCCEGLTCQPRQDGQEGGSCQ